jgi:hypothetical protein
VPVYREIQIHWLIWLFFLAFAGFWCFSVWSLDRPLLYLHVLGPAAMVLFWGWVTVGVDNGSIRARSGLMPWNRGSWRIEDVATASTEHYKWLPRVLGFTDREGELRRTQGGSTNFVIVASAIHLHLKDGSVVRIGTRRSATLLQVLEQNGVIVVRS